jgi:hypothetical protein
MAAETEMTIIIRARDEATRAVRGIASTISGIGKGIATTFLSPLRLVGNVLESIYKRFFSLKALLVGGGAIALFTRALGGVTSDRAKSFEAAFSPDQQRSIDAVTESWRKLGAVIQKIFGDTIAQSSKDLIKIFNDLAKWLADNKNDIAEFFLGVANAIHQTIMTLIGAIQLFKELVHILITSESALAAEEAARRAALQRERDAIRAAGGRQQVTGLLSEEEMRNYGGLIKEVTRSTDDATRAVNRFLIELREIADVMAGAATAAIMSFIDGTRSLAEAFRDMVRSMLQSLAQLFLNRGFQMLFGSLLGATPLGNILGLVGNSNPNFGELGHILPGRASGGPVTRGRGYVVGENGPEFFSPDSNGQIIPNGGGGNYAVHNHFHGPSDPKEVERATGRALMKLLQSHGGVRAAVRSA